ncbi:MAG: hypothetical protein EKK62_03180 [Acidimicrobiia bacterium]|nr:MAG: hypothetical protein EKK62_03180 [Acidimicrobiia bacterium]
MPGPRENSALWDYVVIGEVVLPPDGVNGRARVKAPIQWENDPKKAKGKNGARVTTQGRKQSPVDIEIEIEDGLTLSGQSQCDLTQEAIDRLIEKGPGPFGVAHGATDAGRVRDIIIDEITSPEPGAGRIKWAIKAKRWDVPPSTIGGGGGVGLSPEDAKRYAELKAYAEKVLIPFIKANPDSPFTPGKQLELTAVQAEMKALQSKASATKTPDKSTATKGYYQDGKKGTSDIPLGEIQP